MSDTVSEDSGDEETTGSSYVSKSGIVWSDVPPNIRRLQKKDVLRVKRGPTLKETQVKSLRDAFEYFISRNIMDIIIQETNKKGKTVKGSNWL
jgi:hypothetical protein